MDTKMIVIDDVTDDELKEAIESLAREGELPNNDETKREMLEFARLEFARKKANRIGFVKQHLKRHVVSVGDVSKDPAYECPYCHGRNCELVDADDYPEEGYFDGAKLNSQFFCNDCEKPYNVQFTLIAKSYPNENADNTKENGGENG